LHGREERSFNVTLALLIVSGVRLQRDSPTAQQVFQEWRRGYAPYIATLTDRLGPGETAARTASERWGAGHAAAKL
jgi:hypothetical protein